MTPETRAWRRHIRQTRIPLGRLARHRRDAQRLCAAAIAAELAARGAVMPKMGPNAAKTFTRAA